MCGGRARAGVGAPKQFQTRYEATRTTVVPEGSAFAAFARLFRASSVRCAWSTQMAAKAAMATLPMQAMAMAAMLPEDSGCGGEGG